ncbi:MAG: hypothetical protein R3E02_03580 [Blastomonas sp.]
MFKISESATRVIANDTQHTISGYDEALLRNARLAVSVLETISTSKLPVRDTNHVLKAMQNSSAHLLEARADMARAIGHLTSIKRRSNQAPMAMGCPDEVEEVFTSGEKRVSETVVGSGIPESVLA